MWKARKCNEMGVTEVIPRHTSFSRSGIHAAGQYHCSRAVAHIVSGTPAGVLRGRGTSRSGRCHALALLTEPR